MAERVTIASLTRKIETEADAYAYLEGLRWPDGPVCPHCGHDKAYFLQPKTEVRKTRTGTGTMRRVWKCAKCRKQFSVLTDSIFHGTKIPVRIWLMVVFEMCSSKNGVAAREIERKYGVTNKTAWFMLHRIREAMKAGPLAAMLTGTVTADETFIGGKPGNKHRQGVKRKPVGGGARGGGTTHLQPVVSLVNRDTGEVRSRVVPDVTGATLRKVIAEQVDMAGSTLHTDAAGQYRAIGREFAAHEWVDHQAREYVRGEVTTNHAEGYFSQLKRSLDGTHHHVSREHLPRYLAEFDFRYSTRKDTDTARMQRLMGQAGGRRLAYRSM